MSLPLDWNDQRAFLAALEGGSLSAAARTLGLGQPTVRARIDALEQALGTVLFTRSAKGLLPTDQAHALGDYVRAMAHASDAFQRAASAPPGEIAGTVRLSVSESIGVEVLPPMLVGLRARYPRLVVEIAVDDTMANLSEHEADIAICLHPPTHEMLVIRKVGAMVLGFFAHRDYLAARGVPKDLADLAKHDLIGPDRESVALKLPEAFRSAWSDAKVPIRTDSRPTQFAAARAGLGIAVMHRPVALTDPSLVPVLPEVTVLTRQVWVATHRDLRRTPRIRAAFDHIVKEFTRFTQG